MFQFQTNADIVTMLRLTRLNEEINDGDADTIGGDITYNDVMRDFCNLSHNQPQKLVQRTRIDETDDAQSDAS